MDRWETLQARLFHLGFLGEELQNLSDGSTQGAWLYRQIAQEAADVSAIATAYVAEYQRAAEYHASRGEAV